MYADSAGYRNICSTGDCSLSWHILLNTVIRIMRKTQPCGGSWSTKPRNTGGQKMTVLSRDIYWPFLHGVRPKVSAPGRPPGIRNWGLEEGDSCLWRHASPQGSPWPEWPMVSGPRYVLRRQEPHQELYQVRAQLSSEEQVSSSRKKQNDKWKKK